MSESSYPSIGRKSTKNAFDMRNFVSLPSADNAQNLWSFDNPELLTFPDLSGPHIGSDSFIHHDPETVQALAQQFTAPRPDDEKQEATLPPPPTAAVPAPSEAIADTDMALAVCLVPDVCLTPVGRSVVPIPYQVYGKAGDDDNYSPDVFFNGHRAMRFNSIFSRTYGDEPGVALGVVSGTVADKAEPTSHSTIVRINGHYAVRHGDSCTLNNGNTPGEMIFVQSTMIAAPPQGHAGDAKARQDEEEKNEELQKSQKPQYQTPNERGSDPSVTVHDTKRTTGDVWNRGSSVDENNPRRSGHHDQTEEQPISLGYTYEPDEWSWRKGLVEDELLVDGQNGHLTLNVFNAKSSFSASGSVSREGVDLGIGGGARASSIRLDGAVGNKNAALHGAVEGPAAYVGGEVGARISKEGVTLTAEGEIGVSLMEGKIGGDIATPTFFGWGLYMACETTAGVGLGAKGVAAFDTQGKRKGLTLGAKANIGVGAGLQCSLGVHNED